MVIIRERAVLINYLEHFILESALDRTRMKPFFFFYHLIKQKNIYFTVQMFSRVLYDFEITF